MLEYRMDSLPNTYQYVRTLDSITKSFPFCCAEIGEYTMGDAYFTKRKDLNSFLLIVTVDGLGKMCYRGSSCYLNKGSAILIDCNDYQEYFTVSKHTWHFFYIHFTALNMDAYNPALINKLTPINLRSEEYVLKLMQDIYTWAHQYDIVSYALQSNALSNILTEMVCSNVIDMTSPFNKYRKDIMNLAEYIKENCTKELHLTDFSKKTNLSKHHLIRLFGQQTGMSPYKYMHMCRINLAQTLLRTTDMMTAQIAYEVGYNDSVIFIRHFRSFNNMTPSEYRKQSIILSK